MRLRRGVGRSLFRLGLFTVLAAATINCFSSEKSLPGVVGSGQIIGKVVGPDGSAIPAVQVSTSLHGNAMQTTTGLNGSFTFNVGEVERGQGFNLQFQKTNFDNASAGAIISLPNLKVDIGNVVMNIAGGAEVAKRTIKGRILDNFSFKPLSGANVYTIDSAGLTVSGLTDEKGEFFLDSNYYALESTFVVNVFKTNYIPRSDLIVTVTSEMNNLPGNGTRLYNKFGFIYGYVADDTRVEPGVDKPVSLDDVSVTLLNGNNQQMTCTSSGNPVGTFDPVPLQAGKYCPDLTGITSPMSLAVANPSARTNNSGGFKFQSDFLFIGNRYNISLSKTSPNCQSRSTAATFCYRSDTTYADVNATAADNVVNGSVVKLKWDAWIYGRVRVRDMNTTSASLPHTVCPGTFSSITNCDGNNVTVKLYNSSNTFITQTTTDATGNFVFDSPQILRGQPYILTFERPNAYSRLIGFSNQVVPVNGPVPAHNRYQAPKSLTIPAVANDGTNHGPGPNRSPNLTEAAEDCGAGVVCMIALPPPTRCVAGTVTDYWSGSGIDGATVAVFDGGWRTATTNVNGEFVVESDFTDPTPNAYTVEITKPGYTGETYIDKQTFTFTHNTISVPNCATNLAAQMNLNQGPLVTPDATGACERTAAFPGGAGLSCIPKLKLYPIGIFASVAGQKRFTYQVKQTYEKFLTEKNGLTISGRTQGLVHTSGTAKTQDADAFYLHFDDTPRQLPNVPEGKWANHVPINRMSTTCNLGPNNGPFCSPDVNGVLVEGIGDDVRTIPWELQTYVYYYFYVAKPSSSGQNYTIETTGNTDTHLTLYAQTGALEGTDDNSGSGSNGRISRALPRGWYYLKVRGGGGTPNNVFGFFNVRVTGPVADESDYATMHSPNVPGVSPSYQTVNGSTAYSTTCAPGNGNLVLSWYDSVGHLLYIAAPGENGGCSATATIEKHGPVGGIVRGRFDGTLRRIAPSGSNAIVSNSPRGFFNIIRQE